MSLLFIKYQVMLIYRCTYFLSSCFIGMICTQNRMTLWVTANLSVTIVVCFIRIITCSNSIYSLTQAFQHGVCVCVCVTVSQAEIAHCNMMDKWKPSVDSPGQKLCHCERTGYHLSLITARRAHVLYSGSCYCTAPKPRDSIPDQMHCTLLTLAIICLLLNWFLAWQRTWTMRH